MAISNRNFVVGAECRKLLQLAAQRHLPLTLTNRPEHRWQVYKTHFLSFQSNRLILARPCMDMTEGYMEPTEGQEIAITFKKGYNKCFFVTRIIRCQEFELEPDVYVPAIMITAPQQIEKIQRRNYNRAVVSTDEPVEVEFWSDDPTFTAGPDHWKATLQDLSAGGLSIRMPSGRDPQLQENQQVHMEFVPLPDQPSLCVDARFRHATQLPDDDAITLGFQLVGLEMCEQGRNALRRIGRVISVYQRRRQFCDHPELMTSSRQR